MNTRGKRMVLGMNGIEYRMQGGELFALRIEFMPDNTVQCTWDCLTGIDIAEWLGIA